MKAQLNHLTCTVIDRDAATNEEKYKTVEFYGKTAAVLAKSLGNSQYLSGRFADVTLTQKTNPTTQAPVEGFLGSMQFSKDAAGNEIADSKDRRFKIQIDRMTFTTTNKEAKEYDVSKPVKRDKETGDVTNLEDGKVPGVKSILAALNEEGELFLHVEKTVINDNDVWMIADAKPLTGPTADQKANQPRYSITVTAMGENGIRIAGPEIKDSKDLQTFIKTDLGGKWNKLETSWDAPLPEGMTVGKMYYAVIEKARELQVPPSPEASIKDVAAGAPEGSSLADAAAAVKSKGQKQEVKA